MPVIERQGFHHYHFPRQYLYQDENGRTLVVSNVPDRDRNSFELLDFLLLGRLTVVSTPC
jgi:hypothetical protein